MECCDKRCDEKLPFEKSESLACNSPPVLTRVVSDGDKQDLKEALTELVDGGSHNAFGYFPKQWLVIKPKAAHE